MWSDVSYKGWIQHEAGETWCSYLAGWIKPDLLLPGGIGIAIKVEKCPRFDIEDYWGTEKPSLSEGYHLVRSTALQYIAAGAKAALQDGYHRISLFLGKLKLLATSKNPPVSYPVSQLVINISRGMLPKELTERGMWVRGHRVKFIEKHPISGCSDFYQIHLENGFKFNTHDDEPVYISETSPFAETFE